MPVVDENGSVVVVAVMFLCFVDMLALETETGSVTVDPLTLGDISFVVAVVVVIVVVVVVVGNDTIDRDEEVNPGTQLTVGAVPLKTYPSAHLVQEAAAIELHSVQSSVLQHGRPSTGSQNPITVGQS